MIAGLDAERFPETFDRNTACQSAFLQSLMHGYEIAINSIGHFFRREAAETR